MDQTNPPRRDAVTEPVLQSRLLPRISFRSLLVATALSAVAFAIAYTADSGGIYATAALVGLAFAVISFALWALAFLLSWAVSYLSQVLGAALVALGLLLLTLRVLGITAGTLEMLTEGIWILNCLLIGGVLFFMNSKLAKRKTADNPFADGQLPPQILAPREPSN